MMVAFAVNIKQLEIYWLVVTDTDQAPKALDPTRHIMHF